MVSTVNNEFRNVNFYSRFESGHRKEYIEFSSQYLGGVRVTLLSGMISTKPLLFLMVEECFFRYWLISILRACFGLRTIGLVFRAKECMVSNSIRHRIKRYLLKVLKTIKFSSSLSIIPFFVYPNLENICDDWIYDFQFCDIDFLNSLTNDEDKLIFKNELKTKISNKKIVCAIGKQDKDKGFDKFASLYINSKKLQDDFVFISGGKISGIDKDLIESFELAGGIVINRRITESELVSLYEVADFIWVCYSPCYDQSSGILGRSIQLNKPVIVRKNSVAELIVSNLKHNYLSVDNYASSLSSDLNEYEPKWLDLRNSDEVNLDNLLDLINS